MKIHTKSEAACYRKISNLREVKNILANYDDSYYLSRVDKEKITLTRTTKFKYETVEIYKDSFVEHTICEKRPHGVIITKIQQTYDTTAYSKDEKILVSLIENRYVLTIQTLNLLIGRITFLSPKHIYLLIKSLPILLHSDMTTNFCAEMKYMQKNRQNNWYKSYQISTRVIINDEDVSLIYNKLNGHDKIYRIHDLYNGVINKRNQQDIKNIKLGILPKEAFQLRRMKKINDEENKLVGKTKEPIKYPKEIFIQNLGSEVKEHGVKQMILKI